MLISPSNVGWKYLQNALGSFLDVDIYENVKQISLCQMVSEIRSFFFSIFSSFHYRYRSEFAMCFREKKVITLEIMEIEEFALHFHKCPHPEKDQMPCILHFQSIFDGYKPLLNYNLESEMGDPVFHAAITEDWISKICSHSDSTSQSTKITPATRIKNNFEILLGKPET